MTLSTIQKQDLLLQYLDDDYLKHRDGENKKIYGLQNKNNVSSDIDFKDVLFNKHRIVRKFISPLSESCFSSPVTKFIGTRAQINKASHKFINAAKEAQLKPR